jgi:cytochrome c-type biogenesis protein CcmF
MITFGDSILYLSILVSAVALAGLLLKEMKKSNLLTRLVSPAIITAAGLLTFAYLLLTYYFVTSDFSLDYVWSYSSRDLPLIYKISGTWAGQQGTYLLWVWVIFLSAAWLAQSTKHATAIARRTQIVTVLIGIYFVILTLIQTPFKPIIERPEVVDLIAKGTLPPNFVPPDGNGLNTLLVNFWMIIHPPLMFIGYAAITIPFAAAIMYLLTKDEGWEELSRQYARFTWLFLGIGIAVGGVWAYLVLGWGGFWAWDPVETASFVPWLTLTGFLHAASLHRKNKTTFSIAAPMLAAVSFILVLYAAIVVRSGLFNSVHAFGETSTGTLLLGSIIITSVVSFALGMKRYLGEPEKVEEDWGLWSKRNIFYLSLLLFVILAFISFWGITFPAFIQITQNLKVNVASDTKNFFNVWSYPFTIILLLALGFCLNYKESQKEKQKQTLFAVTAITVLAMFAPIQNFYVLDHNSPFFVREPAIYKLIGGISLLSIFPPLIYAAAAIYKRLVDYLRLKSMRPKIKGIGLAMVHFGVVLIIFGAVISSTLDTKIQGINIPLDAKGQLVPIPDTSYSIKVVDYSTGSLTGATSNPGVRISDIIANPQNYANNVQVSGKVARVVNTQSKTPPIAYTTYFELDDGTGTLWAVTQAPEPLAITEGSQLTVTGSLMAGFSSPSTNTTYDLIMFSSHDAISETSVPGNYNVQSVKLEVYEGDRKIGSGTAEYLEGKGGSGTFPMVQSSITGTEVYVIFQGLGGSIISQGAIAKTNDIYVPLTLQIKPAIDFVWTGIVLLAIGIILIMGVKTRSKGD